MRYTLIAPTDGHYAQLASWVSDAGQCQRWAGPRLGFPFSHAALPVLLQTEPGDTYALVDAQDEEILLGFGQILRREPGTGHLARIIVDPQRRASGVGHRLCTELIRQGAAEHGFRSMTLWVYIDNPPAIRLYESLGFMQEPQEGNPGCQFMRLNLAPGELQATP